VTGDRRFDLPDLTLRSLQVRPVVVPFARPLVTRVGRFEQRPLLLVDLHTDQRPTGRAYLAPT